MEPHANSLRKNIGKLLQIVSVSVFLLLVVLPCLVFSDQKSDFKRVKAALASGDLLEAQSLLENIIDNYSGRTELKAKYLLGQVLYNRAEYSEAAAVFSKISSAYPDWEYADRATYGLAMAQCGMLDYPDAIRTLETLMSLYPESETLPNALYWLGEANYRRGDYDGALAKFNQFLSEHPGHGLGEYAFDSLAWCLEQKSRFSEAIASRQEFLKEFPDSPLKSNAEFCLATDYLKTGGYKKAIDHYLAAGKSNAPSPLSEQALLRAGLIAVEHDRPRESIPILEKLLAKNPNQENAKRAMIVLGNCYLRNGQYKKGEDIFLSLLAESSNEVEKRTMSFQLALAEVGLREFGDAADHIASVMGQPPQDSLTTSAALVQASCLLNLDQPGAAAEKLRSLLDAEPPSQRPPDLLFALAGSLILTDRFDEAEPVLAELSANKNNVAKWPQVPYYDGLCLFQMSQFANAGKRFGQSAEIGKPVKLLPLASFMKANSFLKAEKPAEAISCYDAFLKRWPDSELAVSALYQSGLASLILGKHDDVSSSLERVINDNPSAMAATPARFFLAVSRMRNRDLVGAMELFRFLLANNSDSELADRAAFAAGIIEFGHGNYAGAGELFKGIPARFAQTQLADSAMFFSAATRYRQGLTGAASADFQKLPVLFPESPLAAEAIMLAGLCEEKSNRPGNALALYKRSMVMEPGLTPDVREDSLYGTAWVEMRTANQEAAIAALSKLAQTPKNNHLVEQAYFWLGRLYYASGQWEKAKESLLNLSNIFPGSELADSGLFFAGRAARQSLDWGTAIGLFDQLCKRYPKSPLIEQARIEAAECMIESGRADEAVGEFKKFIETHVQSPLRPLVLYDMGKALQRAGKFEEAIEQFRAAEGGEMNELAARSRFAIAECLAELDRNGEAIAELISMVRGAFPAGWPERAQLQVARLLERDGQIEEARHVYVDVADVYSDDAASMVALKAIKRLDAEKRIVVAP